MKLVTVLMALVVSGTALAQSSHRANNEGLLQLSDRVNSLIQSEARYLTREQARAVKQSLRDIENIILGSGDGGSNPYPGDMITLRGRVEWLDFAVEGNSLDQVNDACMQKMQQNGISSVDDISVSANYGAIRTLKNSTGYWKGPGEVCNVIIQEARALGYEHTGMQTVLIGKIEWKDYVIKANGLVDATMKCERLVKENGISSADDITVARDHRKLQVLKNSTGYWKGPIEICQKVVGVARY